MVHRSRTELFPFDVEPSFVWSRTQTFDFAPLGGHALRHIHTNDQCLISLGWLFGRYTAVVVVVDTIRCIIIDIRSDPWVHHFDRDIILLFFNRGILRHLYITNGIGHPITGYTLLGRSSNDIQCVWWTMERWLSYGIVQQRSSITFLRNNVLLRQYGIAFDGGTRDRCDAYEQTQMHRIDRTISSDQESFHRKWYVVGSIRNLSNRIQW